MELLQAIRRRGPRGRLAIVADNLSIHVTRSVRAWLSAQAGRVGFEFLPLHASWLNQIEIWFIILERQALTRSSDTAYRERAPRIRRFDHHWNRIAHPFRWTFKGNPLCPYAVVELWDTALVLLVIKYHPARASCPHHRQAWAARSERPWKRSSVAIDEGT